MCPLSFLGHICCRYPTVRDDNGHLVKDKKLLRPIFLLRGWQDEWDEIQEHQQQIAEQKAKKAAGLKVVVEEEKKQANAGKRGKKGEVGLTEAEWAERGRSMKRAKNKAFKEEFGTGFLQLWPPPLVFPMARCMSKL